MPKNINKKIKICYFRYEGHIHVDRMLKWFAANKNYEVHLLTERPNNIPNVIMHDISYESLHPWIKRMRMGPLRKVFVYLRVRRIIKTISPDIIHAHTLYYPAVMIAFIWHHRKVITPWNGDIHWVPKRSWLYSWLVKYALRTCKTITVHTTELFQTSMDIIGARAKKVHYIYFSGPDIDVFKPGLDIAYLQKRYKLENKKIVLSTRSIADIYGIDTVINSIPYVRAKVPDVKYLFIYFYTNPKLLSEYIELIDKLGVKNDVVLAGKIDYKESPAFFNMADVVVSVPRKDSLSTAVMEAMACGTPVVISDLGAYKNIIMDGKNGFAVPIDLAEKTAEAIIKILMDPALKSKFAAINHEKVKAMDFNINMAKMDKLYKDLLVK